MGSSKRLLEVATRVIQRADKELTTRILGKSFLTEPLLSHAPVKLSEMEKFVSLQWDDILRDNITLLAETKDRVPAGCSMALDFSTKASPEFESFVTKNEHFSAVVSLLQHMEEHYVKSFGFTMDNFPRGHTVHMFMLATEPHFRNQGIASTLRAAALDHYKAMGYRYAMSEASSLFTRRICDKFGFQTLLRMPYEEWFPKGSLYTKQVADGHDAMHLMMKEL